MTALTLSQSRVRLLLNYDPLTGALTWRRTKGRMKRGAEAGYLVNDGEGYRKLSIDGRRQYAHRVIFIWMLGFCPEFVDHRNGIRGDNRWANLRSATKSQNNQNSRPKGGRSQYKGVSWCKRAGKWIATINAKGRHIDLGLHTNEAQAAIEYNRAAKKHFGEFAWLNPIEEAE